MAVGDDAVAYGLPIVDGASGEVQQGFTEINRTRDMVAELGVQVPQSNAAAQTRAGITQGTAAPDPTLGAVGDIYFQIH